LESRWSQAETRPQPKTNDLVWKEKKLQRFFLQKYRGLLLCDEHKLQQKKEEKKEDIYQPYTNVILVWSVSCSWHQTTNLFSPNHEYFFDEILCYYFFNDAVRCILKHLQDLEKVRWFQYKNLSENKK